MAAASKALPSLPDEPHHPKSDFAFPKRTFGKSKPVLCSAQSQWFSSWPFLHYDGAQDVVFCHTCVTALKLDRMKTSNNAANAFVSIVSCIKLRLNVLKIGYKGFFQLEGCHSCFQEAPPVQIAC